MIMPPKESQLFSVDAQLDDLVRKHESAREPEREMIYAALKEYASELTLNDPDIIASYIGEYSDQADRASAEVGYAKRETERRKSRLMRINARIDLVRDIALAALQSANKGSREGDKFVLKRCEVGGVRALDIYSPAMVPGRYKVKQIELPHEYFAAVERALHFFEAAKPALPYLLTAKEEIRSDRVRAALERNEEVPGARLEPRRERLEVR